MKTLCFPIKLAASCKIIVLQLHHFVFNNITSCWFRLFHGSWQVQKKKEITSLNARTCWPVSRGNHKQPEKKTHGVTWGANNESLENIEPGDKELIICRKLPPDVSREKTLVCPGVPWGEEQAAPFWLRLLRICRCFRRKSRAKDKKRRVKVLQCTKTGFRRTLDTSNSVCTIYTA